MLARGHAGDQPGLFERGVIMQGPAYLPGFGKYLSIAHTREEIDQAAEAFVEAVGVAQRSN